MTQVSADLAEAVGRWNELVAPYGISTGDVAKCLKWLESLPGGYRPKFYQQYVEIAHSPDPGVADLAWIAIITRVMLKHIQKIQ